MLKSEERAAAVQACVDTYAGRPLDFRGGDCVRLARFALHKQRAGVTFLKGVRWSSAPSALRQMRKLGFENLVDAMDATGLARIAPAAAWPGDIIALPVGEGDPFGASLTVRISNGNVLGFGEGGSACGVMRPRDFLAAWRVEHG